MHQAVQAPLDMTTPHTDPTAEAEAPAAAVVQEEQAQPAAT